MVESSLSGSLRAPRVLTLLLHRVLPIRAKTATNKPWQHGRCHIDEPTRAEQKYRFLYVQGDQCCIRNNFFAVLLFSASFSGDSAGSRLETRDCSAVRYLPYLISSVQHGAPCSYSERTSQRPSHYCTVWVTHRPV